MLCASGGHVKMVLAVSRALCGLKASTCYCEAAAVNEAMLQEVLHHSRCASNLHTHFEIQVIF